MNPPPTSIPIHEIGFDFDGVVADIGEAFIRLACEQYDYCSFTLDDIISFQIERCIDMPQELINKIFSDILIDSRATGLRPLEDAVDVLSEMSLNSRVTIITARPDAAAVHDWLEVFFAPEVKSKIQLIAMGDHDGKVRYAREHGLKFFVDDRLETCLQMAEAGITPLVFNQPWNQNKTGLLSVSGWREIRAMLQFR